MYQIIKYTALIVSLLLAATVKAQDNTLELSEAIQKALENNYGIVISKAEKKIAEMNNDWGTAGRYPTIGIDVASNNYAELTNDSYSNRISAGAGLNWILFDGYRVKATKNKLEQLEELAQGQSAVVVESTIQDVITGYYDVLLQQEQLEVLQQVKNLSRDRYEYEVMRKEMGNALTYNVLQAKNIFLEDSTAYLQQKVEMRNATRNLNFVMGESPNETWQFTGSLETDTATYQLGDLLNKMQSNNQTLENQYTNLQIQQEDTKIEKSERYPTVRLSTGVENIWSRSKSQGSEARTDENIEPYGNVTLSYDLFTGGTRKRAIEAAKIEEEITHIGIEEIKHSLTNELYNLHELYNTRKTLLNVAVENLETAELNLEIAEEKFKTGAINSFNYRDIQLIYLNAAFQKLQSLYNIIDSETRLTRITGGFINEEDALDR
ncbi:MAG: TolC family protein [Bacteroidota bacterium]